MLPPVHSFMQVCRVSYEFVVGNFVKVFVCGAVYFLMHKRAKSKNKSFNLVKAVSAKTS